jgi:hypothetical protein
VETLADVLHRIVDLTPWREEAHKLLAHEIVSNELVPADAGSHAAAEPASTEPDNGKKADTTAAAGKA